MFSRGLFLDDERNPRDVTWIHYPPNVKWTIVRNSKDFLEKVSQESFDLVSFDHDIQDFTKNGEEVTGYDLLKKYLEKWDASCVFHTQNIVGKDNMSKYYYNWRQHNG